MSHKDSWYFEFLSPTVSQVSPLFDTQASEGYNVLVPNKGTMINTETTEADWYDFWHNEDTEDTEDYC